MVPQSGAEPARPGSAAERETPLKGAACVVLFLTLLAGCSGSSRLDLTTLGRGTWQRPEDVIGALSIPPGARVADLGAGEGYFLPYLRDAVGPEGNVYAVEIDPEKIATLEEQFGAWPNLDIVSGEAGDPLLPDASVDLVLLVNTYHHIENRDRYFERLKSDLAQGATVAIIEPDGDLSGLLALFLSEGHTSRAADIRREMTAAGYRHAESLDLLPVQVFEVFRVD